jgi:hypothetical protein
VGGRKRPTRGQEGGILERQINPLATQNTQQQQFPIFIDIKISENAILT